jgi:hypothetical protein
MPCGYARISVQRTPQLLIVLGEKAIISGWSHGDPDILSEPRRMLLNTFPWTGS